MKKSQINRTTSNHFDHDLGDADEIVRHTYTAQKVHIQHHNQKKEMVKSSNFRLKSDTNITPSFGKLKSGTSTQLERPQSSHRKTPNENPGRSDECNREAIRVDREKKTTNDYGNLASDVHPSLTCRFPSPILKQLDAPSLSLREQETKKT